MKNFGMKLLLVIVGLQSAFAFAGDVDIDSLPSKEGETETIIMREYQPIEPMNRSSFRSLNLNTYIQMKRPLMNDMVIAQPDQTPGAKWLENQAQQSPESDAAAINAYIAAHPTFVNPGLIEILGGETGAILFRVDNNRKQEVLQKLIARLQELANTSSGHGSDSQDLNLEPADAAR